MNELDALLDEFEAARTREHRDVIRLKIKQLFLLEAGRVRAEAYEDGRKVEAVSRDTGRLN